MTIERSHLSERYNPRAREQKWQTIWDEKKIFQTVQKIAVKNIIF